MSPENDHSIETTEQSQENSVTTEQSTENSASTEQGKAPEIAWTDDKGVGYTVEQLHEFRDSGLRQSDYTKKMQEAAKLREEADAKVASLAEASELLQEHAPDVYKYLTGMGPKPVKQPEFDDETQKTVWQLSQKVEQLEKSYTVKQLDAQITAGLSKLPPDTDKNAVITEMRRIGTTDPQVAYRNMSFDKIAERAKKEAEAEFIAKSKAAKETNIKSPENASRSTGAPAPTASLSEKLAYAAEKAFKT